MIYTRTKMFKLEEFFNDAANLFTDSKYLQNPIWVAVIIVIVIILTIFYVINSEVDTIYDDTSMLHLYVKIGIISFLICSAVIFLHNKSIGKFYEKKYESMNQTEIVKRIVAEVSENIKKIPEPEKK
jgi:hypothetical protein